MPARPIVRTNTYELVAMRLMEEIASRELRQGDSIPTERELSIAFGVGRSSVREGLRMLESHGVVRPTGQAQFVVGDYDELLVPSLQMLVSLGQTDLAQVTALRSIVEVEAAGLAARAATGEDLEAMEQAQARFEQALAQRSSDALEHDLAFHMALVNASRNNALVAVAVAVRTVIERLIAGAFRPLEEAAPQHEAILRAVRDGDGAQARVTMRAHMDWILETLPSPADAPPRRATIAFDALAAGTIVPALRQR
jgi:GntR family transcriptional regulator, transcriptional repressor for pyruvate dehydrogenase complex